MGRVAWSKKKKKGGVGEKRPGETIKGGRESPRAARGSGHLVHWRHQKEEMLNSQRPWVPPEPLASLFISSLTEMFISISGKLHLLYPNPPTLHTPP